MFKFKWSLVKRSIKHWYQRRTRGWDDSDTWSLSDVIAEFTLPRLIRFRELNNGYPCDVEGPEEWNHMIDDMIYALGICSREDDGVIFDCDWDRLQRGLDYFGRYFRDLWW